MEMKQQTLKSSFTLQGKGLHTGLDIEITFLPAPENHGYKIQRVDLDGQPVLDAVDTLYFETVIFGSRNQYPTRNRTGKKRHNGKYHRTRYGRPLRFGNR